jgi:PIN domain nuclease of toxin-antitoxin system
VIAFLDTQVCVWTAQGDVHRLSKSAREMMQSAELLISPIVLIELQYLFEIERIVIPPHDLAEKLQREIGIHIHNGDFLEVAKVCFLETWTRDPFDRLIVSHAKMHGMAYLISSDEKIKKHYGKTIW